MLYLNTKVKFCTKRKNVKLCVQSEWKVLHVDSHFVPVGCQLKKPIRGVNQIFENP